MTRAVIVNADDFGASTGVNRGVIEAHDRGVVTSASLMVRRPAAGEAAALAGSRDRLSLGLHLDLGEWVHGEDGWTEADRVVDVTDPAAVATEVDRQLDAFVGLTGALPTHLDSHQHVHRHPPASQILLEAGRRLGVPVRDHDGRVRYRGDFYGQTGKGDPLPEAISVGALTALLAALPPGVTELGCHPGYGGDLDSPYRWERQQEVRVLCDPAVRQTLDAERIVLCSFADLVHAAGWARLGGGGAAWLG